MNDNEVTKIDVLVEQTVEYFYVYHLYARYNASNKTPEVNYRIGVLARVLNFMLSLPSTLSYPRSVITASQVISSILSASEGVVKLSSNNSPGYRSALVSFCEKMQVFRDEYPAQNRNAYLLDLLGLLAAGVRYWLVHRSVYVSL